MRISDWSSDVCSSDLVAADPSQSVEQFAQKALAAALMFPLVAVLPAMTAIFGYSKTNAAQRPRAVVSDAALDDLVEFAAIEPDPTTLRAIVDLDALPLPHDEIDEACRAQQPLGRTAKIGVAAGREKVGRN